ncbi:MAG TPA: DUF1565 domain-containing protein, partial [Lacunisphaera sp.]|nr:DUF1565 domain-containing protein [Lacunisphaera sp.]
MHKSPSLLRPFLLAGAFLAAATAPAATIAPGPVAAAPVDLAAYRTVLYVDQAGGDDVQGTGAREHPFASIDHALEVAGHPAADARVAILVSQGRYVQPTFVLKPHVDLFGGFAAPGGAREVYTHPTILDGQELRRLVIGADDARLDGFHLLNGRVRGKGAAILCDGTAPVIANSIFSNNRTLIPSPWAPRLLHETANDGGAVMCLNGAAPRLEHNLFYDNSTECGRGAAIASDRAAAPHIVENVFANNTAGLADPMRSSDGGAVTFFRWSEGEFTGNVVVANQSLTR